MPASAARTAGDARIAFDDVLSDDGTRLRAWTNDPDGLLDGPTVVLCNGLGTSAWAWPALLAPDCGVRVVSWNHRGTGGSDRPADPQRVGHRGVRRGRAVGHGPLRRRPGGAHGLVDGRQHHVRARGPATPSGSRGLFAVAGVPGDTFATMLGPLRLPHGAARALTVSLSRALKYTGKALTPITTRLPVGPEGDRRAHPLRVHAPGARPGAGRASRSRSSSPPRSTGTSTSPCGRRRTRGSG